MAQNPSLKVLTLAFALTSVPDVVQAQPAHTIAAIPDQDSITILVTDSGLGGLSVVADIERRARLSRRYRTLDIVFASALPEAHRGYNTMQSVDEKVRVFQDAMDGMVRWYRPDMVLVACNTLSVLIPRLRLDGAIPLLGIVEPGVEMLEEALKKDTNATAIIFGTETTIAAGTHRSMLIGRGIRPDRIVEQACPGLAGEIESDAGSDLVAASIELFAGEAAAKIRRPEGGIVAGLCCTHYGYCSGIFEAALHAVAPGRISVVNPNDRLGDFLFPAVRAPSGQTAAVSVRVISRALISAGEVESIARLVDPVSPPTATALRHYEHKRDLFPYDGR